MTVKLSVTRKLASSAHMLFEKSIVRTCPVISALVSMLSEDAAVQSSRIKMYIYREGTVSVKKLYMQLVSVLLF